MTVCAEFTCTCIITPQNSQIVSSAFITVKLEKEGYSLLESSITVFEEPYSLNPHCINYQCVIYSKFAQIPGSNRTQLTVMIMQASTNRSILGSIGSYSRTDEPANALHIFEILGPTVFTKVIVYKNYTFVIMMVFFVRC